MLVDNKYLIVKTEGRNCSNNGSTNYSSQKLTEVEFFYFPSTTIYSRQREEMTKYDRVAQSPPYIDYYIAYSLSKYSYEKQGCTPRVLYLLKA